MSNTTESLTDTIAFWGLSSSDGEGSTTYIQSRGLGLYLRWDDHLLDPDLVNKLTKSELIAKLAAISNSKPAHSGRYKESPELKKKFLSYYVRILKKIIKQPILDSSRFTNRIRNFTNTLPIHWVADNRTDHGWRKDLEIAINNIVSGPIGLDELLGHIKWEGPEVMGWVREIYRVYHLDFELLKEEFDPDVGAESLVNDEDPEADKL